MLAIVVASPQAHARTFQVVAYNVENLFDIDGVSAFDDYKPPNYGPRELSRKLEGISKVLQRFNEGAGPEIILFSEIEADRTPQSTVADLDAFLDR